jgi:hypothetical protein
MIDGKMHIACDLDRTLAYYDGFLRWSVASRST